jgi:exodeoxyribonuclease III
MKIATWNVNSINVRLPHVVKWLEEHRVDVLCLQETKCVDAKFPFDAFRDLGYNAEVFGQPTYNGVAIVSLWPVADVQRGFADDDFTSPRRLIAGTVGTVRVLSAYIPNGSAVGTDKYAFKLEWLKRLRHHLDHECDPNQLLALCGDYNVAPEERDVHDPAAWEGQILFSAPERETLQVVKDWGLVDTFRLHEAGSGFYSWWDYRAGSFRRNDGLRIDHVWASAPLAEKCVGAWIDKVPRGLERPSDHAPVVAEFAL